MSEQSSDTNVHEKQVACEVAGQTKAAMRPLPSLASTDSVTVSSNHGEEQTPQLKDITQAGVAVLFVMGLIFVSLHAIHYAGY